MSTRVFHFCVSIAIAAWLSVFVAASDSRGEILFTEDFTNSSAGWANFNSTALLTHHASGGPDGGAYASGPRTFSGQTAGNTPVTLRARHDDPWNASGDAFKRNWNADGIRQIGAWVKHDVPNSDLQFFARVAGPIGFPGHIYGSTTTVAPDTWTYLTFDVSPSSAQLLSPEGSDWLTVFNDVGHLQFGPIVPAGFDTDPAVFNFSIDKVSIATPEPTSLVLLAGGTIGLVALSRRRRERLAGE
jgi:hypothetical protein